MRALVEVGFHSGAEQEADRHERRTADEDSAPDVVHHISTVRHDVRVRFTRTVTVAVVLLLLASGGARLTQADAVQAPAGADWVGYLGGPLHQSIANDKTITRSDIGGLVARWRWKLPAVAGRDRTIFATPATWRGTMYVGGDTGLLYALDTAHGTVRWKRDFGVVPML